jgi:hypothetical protein
MKSSLRWKSVCAAVAAAALANGVILVTPAAALPPICTQWGWSECDPLYARGTPEWFACFEEASTIGCPWWDGNVVGKSPVGVKPEDMAALARQ